MILSLLENKGQNIYEIWAKISRCDLVQEDTRLHIEYVMRRLQRAATTLYGTKEYVSRRQKNALMKILCLINVQLSLVPVRTQTHRKLDQPCW